MRGDFTRLAERYGQRVTVRRPGGAEMTARCFLQPLRGAGEEREVPTPLGLVRRDRFLYLGEPGVSLDGEGLRLLWRGLALGVRSAALVRSGGEDCHWRAVLLAEEVL